MERRDALKLVLAAGAAPLADGCARGAHHDDAHVVAKSTMPAIFLAHGSPLTLDDDVWFAELNAWARAMPAPKAILVLSAHWVDAPVTLGATRTVPLYYDFYGFPQRYYEVKYPAPGAPELADRVRALLSAKGPVASAPDRGLDHGAFVPLMAMYPDASVPVLQASLPSLKPDELFDVGRKLAPLRDEGVLIIGSGFLTHNLRSIDWRNANGTPSWARELDDWCADVLSRRDADALLDYKRRAPGVREALPTHEHFVPVIATLGASIDATKDTAKFPITGFTYGSFTKRSVELGA